MKWNWIYGVVVAGALTIPAAAQISVYIGHPPPRARYERRGPVPGPGYAWVNGYWSPQGRSISVGAGALGPSALSRGTLGQAPLSSPAAGLGGA